jgi:hypothetical protein
MPIFLKLKPSRRKFFAACRLCFLRSLAPAMYSSRGRAPSAHLSRSFRSLSRWRLVSLEIMAFRCTSSSGVILSMAMIR